MHDPKIRNKFKRLLAQGKVVLGSSSKRRKEILSLLGIKYRIARPKFDESSILKSINANDGTWWKQLHYTSNVRTTLMHIVDGKYRSLAAKYRKSLVFCFDTIVCDENRCYGKPKNYQEAVEMLTHLNDRKHTVITACLAGCGEDTVSQLFSTQVEFKDNKKEVYEKYVRRDRVLDAAGAYKIQQNGLALVRSIHGSWHNVVGLPIEFITQFQ